MHAYYIIEDFICLNMSMWPMYVFLKCDMLYMWMLSVTKIINTQSVAMILIDVIVPVDLLG